MIDAVIKTLLIALFEFLFTFMSNHFLFPKIYRGRVLKTTASKFWSAGIWSLVHWSLFFCLIVLEKRVIVPEYFYEKPIQVIVFGGLYASIILTVFMVVSVMKKANAQ